MIIYMINTIVEKCFNKTFLLFLTWALFANTGTAFAYVDPGSGSVIVTTILGLFAAIGYTFRKFFYNIRAKLFGRQDKTDDRSLDD